MRHLAHWDDVEGTRREVGPLAATWRDPGTAAGTEGVDVNRVDVGRPAGTRVAHAFRAGAGTGLEYLAYGTREPNDIVYYPRSGKVSLRGVDVMGRIEPLGYWDGEP